VIYLDAAGTTAVRREVLQAMWPYLSGETSGEFGNPSSQHDLGKRAARAVDDARKRIAFVLGCRASEIIFTSGGTESDNLAVKGIALANPRGRHIVTTPIEHEAVLACCDYLRRHHDFEITYLPVDEQGRLDACVFGNALRDDTTLCSVMMANNEVGTIQPVPELAALARERGIPFHTDAVQAAGALRLNVAGLGVDALSLAGHKIGTPKGIGLLYLRGRLQIEPVLHGGGQERGRRSGTENVAGIVGLATALEIAASGLAERSARIVSLRDKLIAGIREHVPSAVLTGDPQHRLPNNASFCFPSVSGEAVLLGLEERGIICSSGSACAAGSDEPSHVLIAMGFSKEVAQTAVRFTLSDCVAAENIGEVVRAVSEVVARIGG